MTDSVQAQICASKQFFKTKSDANRVANTISKRGNNKPLIYKCPECSGWHFTQRKPGHI